ncbi:MAG: hypothetical protein R3F59_33050 [Myxococcota bacterium]
MPRSLLFVVLAACGRDPAEGTCDDLCHELVVSCDYAAFPSLESCLQGCLYDASQGADLEGQLACTVEAACDTFAIVECEHTYGVE